MCARVCVCEYVNVYLRAFAFDHVEERKRFLSAGEAVLTCLDMLHILGPSLRTSTEHLHITDKKCTAAAVRLYTL